MFGHLAEADNNTVSLPATICLAFIYFEPDPDEQSRRGVNEPLTRDDARRIAANIGRLPTFIEADKYRNAKGE